MGKVIVIMVFLILPAFIYAQETDKQLYVEVVDTVAVRYCNGDPVDSMGKIYKIYFYSETYEETEIVGESIEKSTYHRNKIYVIQFTVFESDIKCDDMFPFLNFKYE